MHISYKIGLFLIFILSLSFNHTRAAPTNNKTSATVDDDYADDDYDDYYDDNGAAVSNSTPLGEEKPNNIYSTTAATLSSSLFNLFNMPSSRSNHVVEPTCPKSCHCLEDYKYIDCSHGRLTAVPHDIPTTAIIVNLSHNHINGLRKTDFSLRLKMQEIDLSNNFIEKLEAEMFEGLPRLQRLRLASNRLTSVDPDTFRGASDLSLLDLSNNPIKLPEKGSFLNQRSLLELNCRNCSWTEIYENTFRNTSDLTALRIDHNDFDKKINTRAFVPLKNLIKLRLPELDQNSTEELCNLLKFIDNISFKRFEVSCYELVLGASYNDSIILVTDPPFKQPTGVEPTTETAVENAQTNMNEKDSKIMSSNITHLMGLPDNGSDILTASIGETAAADPTKKDIKSEEESYQVPISREAINYMLIGLMVISVIGIIIGIIFRKDVGGIKTKCCRTKKPLDDKTIESNGVAAEEIPLNKLATT